MPVASEQLALNGPPFPRPCGLLRVRLTPRRTETREEDRGEGSGQRPAGPVGRNAVTFGMIWLQLRGM